MRRGQAWLKVSTEAKACSKRINFKLGRQKIDVACSTAEFGNHSLWFDGTLCKRGLDRLGADSYFSHHNCVTYVEVAAISFATQAAGILN